MAGDTPTANMDWHDLLRAWDQLEDERARLNARANALSEQLEATPPDQRAARVNQWKESAAEFRRQYDQHQARELELTQAVEALALADRDRGVRAEQSVLDLIAKISELPQ